MPRQFVLALVLIIPVLNAFALPARTKVGVILPLTGEFAFVGQTFRRGIELAAAQHPDLTLVFEDDGGLDPRRALDAVRKLIAIDQVAMILFTSHDVTEAVSPVLARARVPGLILWDSSLELLAEHPWVYAMGYLPEQAGDTLAAFAAHCLRVHTVAVIRSEVKWGDRITTGFRRRASVEGLSLVFDQSATLGTTDFQSVSAKIAKLDPDAVFAPLYGQALVTFIRQVRAMGFRGTIMTGELLFEPELRALGRLSEGLYLTNAWLDGLSSDGLTKPDRARLALAYDALQFLSHVNTRWQAQGRDRSLVDVLRAEREVGLTGVIDFSRQKISPRYQPVLRIDGGKFERAKCDRFESRYLDTPVSIVARQP